MHNKRGFSLVELMFVIVIGAVLVAMMLPAFGEMQARRSARNARDAFMYMAGRARAESIQRGRQIDLRLDPTTGRAVVVNPLNNDTIDRLNFTGDYKAAVTTSTGALVQICYTPRGYATCPSALRTATFKTGRDSARVRIRPLGQVDKL